MTCRELIEFLMDYLSDNLPAGERSVFEAHLSVCPSCVAYLASYRETLRLEQAAYTEQEALPAEVPEELVQAILAARRANA